MNHLRDLPPLRSVPCTLDAALYNHARLVLLRIGNPLELELEGLAADMVLEHKHWVCYHYQQISLPLIAWEGFGAGRNALDAPVACTMHLYHQHSWLLYPRVLQALDRHLQTMLASR